MSDRAPYSRVYWSVMDDPKFDGIREDPRHFGSWGLLLIVADMAWPAPAFPPPAVSKTSMRLLIEAGLVDSLSGGRFRIHGLDAERGRRRDAARTGSKRDPNGEQTGPERSLARGTLDETSLDKTRVDEDEPTAREGLPNLNREAIRALEERTGHTWSQAGERQLSEYDRLVGDHGLEAVLAGFDAISGGKRMTARQLIWPALRVLEPFSMPDPKADAAEAKEERAEVRARRTNEEVWRRRIETFRFTGHWEAEWGAPPSKEGVPG